MLVCGKKIFHSSILRISLNTCSTKLLIKICTIVDSCFLVYIQKCMLLKLITWWSLLCSWCQQSLQVLAWYFTVLDWKFCLSNNIKKIYALLSKFWHVIQLQQNFSEIQYFKFSSVEMRNLIYPLEYKKL